MKEMLKWVDAQSDKYLVYQVAFSDGMERQAAALLNLLLIAAGGALAWSLALWKEAAPLPLTLAMAAMALWLFAVSALLQVRVLMTGDFYAPGYRAQPTADKLFSVEADDNQWMRWMMDHRQIAIDANHARNDRVGRWLNICRMLAIATPLPGIIAAAVAFYR